MAAEEVLIGTTACADGWGWFGGARYPSRRVFRSADDRYIVVLTIRLASGNVEFAAYQTSGTGFLSWGSKDTIWTSTDGTINDASIDAWQDASDNIYVCMSNRVSTGRCKFVKFTKTATTWTKGTVASIHETSSYPPANMQIAKNEVTGRVWTVVNKLNYNVTLFYSDNDGASWTQGVGLVSGDSHYQNQPAICCYDKYVICAARESGTNKIVVFVHDDTGAVGAGWNSTQQGTSATGVNDGEFLVLLPIGKPYCNVLFLCAYTDGTTKRSRWTAPNNWTTLTTTFTETTSGLHNRAQVEGAALGRAILWDKANNAYEYDYVADTLSAKGYGQPSGSPGTKGGDGLWIALRSTSTGTTMSIYFRYEQYATAMTNFDRLWPLQARALIEPSLVLPVHARKNLLRDIDLPLAALVDNSVGASFSFPVHARAQVNVDRAFPVASKEYRVAIAADRALAVHARATKTFDFSLAVQARTTLSWTKDSPESDVWVKDGAVSDDWTKDNPLADSWGKD